MASIKDVAREAKVSIGTVDRIIHQRGRFSPETAERVKQAMEDLGYTPNFHARGLRNQWTGTFYALIPLPEQDSGYWAIIGDGILRASRFLASYGCTVEVVHFDRYKSGSFSNAVEHVASSDCSGLLVAPVSLDTAEPELNSLNIPYILLDTDLKDSDRLSFLGENSCQSGRLAARMLNLQMGICPDPLVWAVTPPGAGSHISQRMEGFLEYSRIHGSHWSLRQLELDSDRREIFFDSLSDQMEREGMLPQGIFVANSLVYHCAAWLEEMDLPTADIALVGYDLIPGKEEYLHRGVIDFILTQQPEEQGYQGMMMLYRKLVLKREIPETWIAPLNLITLENIYSFEKQLENEII